MPACGKRDIEFQFGSSMYERALVRVPVRNFPGHTLYMYGLISSLFDTNVLSYEKVYWRLF